MAAMGLDAPSLEAAAPAAERLASYSTTDEKPAEAVQATAQVATEPAVNASAESASRLAVLPEPTPQPPQARPEPQPSEPAETPDDEGFALASDAPAPLYEASGLPPGRAEQGEKPLDVAEPTPPPAAVAEPVPAPAAPVVETQSPVSNATEPVAPSAPAFQPIVPQEPQAQPREPVANDGFPPAVPHDVPPAQPEAVERLKQTELEVRPARDEIASASNLPADFRPSEPDLGGPIEQVSAAETKIAEPVADPKPNPVAETASAQKDVDRALRRIDEVDTRVSFRSADAPDPKEKGQYPEPAAKAMLAELQSNPKFVEQFAKQPTQAICYAWDAPALCHKPLYFEEVNLERYGYSPRGLGWAQPAISGAHFFAMVPALPYRMWSEAPLECVYDLGNYRPGSCVPYRIHYPPWRPGAGAVEAGIATGLIFAIP
jgi:hypothetical protein